MLGYRIALAENRFPLFGAMLWRVNRVEGSCRQCAAALFVLVGTTTELENYSQSR